jgi:hypothetical protein
VTTNVRRDDNDMCRQRNDDETMGTIQPAGQIQRRRHRSSRRIGVGVEGGQGGALGGRVGGVLRTLLTVELGSRIFFQQRDVRACTHNNSSKKYGTPIM